MAISKGISQQCLMTLEGTSDWNCLISSHITSHILFPVSHNFMVQFHLFLRACEIPHVYIYIPLINSRLKSQLMGINIYTMWNTVEFIYIII